MVGDIKEVASGEPRRGAGEVWSQTDSVRHPVQKRNLAEHRNSICGPIHSNQMPEASLALNWLVAQNGGFFDPKQLVTGSMLSSYIPPSPVECSMLYEVGAFPVSEVVECHFSN